MFRATCLSPAPSLAGTCTMLDLEDGGVSGFGGLAAEARGGCAKRDDVLLVANDRQRGDGLYSEPVTLPFEEVARGEPQLRREAWSTALDVRDPVAVQFVPVRVPELQGGALYPELGVLSQRVHTRCQLKASSTAKARDSLHAMTMLCALVSCKRMLGALFVAWMRSIGESIRTSSEKSASSCRRSRSKNASVDRCSSFTMSASQPESSA